MEACGPQAIGPSNYTVLPPSFPSLFLPFFLPPSSPPSLPPSLPSPMLFPSIHRFTFLTTKLLSSQRLDLTGRRCICREVLPSAFSPRFYFASPLKETTWRRLSLNQESPAQLSVIAKCLTNSMAALKLHSKIMPREVMLPGATLAPQMGREERIHHHNVISSTA